MIRPPPRSTLFPYPPLFRSWKIFFAFWLALVAAAAGSGAAVWWHRYAREAAEPQPAGGPPQMFATEDRKSTRLNSSHLVISYAVFCLKKKKTTNRPTHCANR